MNAAISTPFAPTPTRIARRTRETADVVTFHLEPVGGSFAFAPGQFNMLYAFGAGEVAVSISGDADDATRLVHTVRAVGSVTRAIARLGRGDTLGVRGPYGTGWPVERARGRHLVVVAGGLGLAPLRPVVYWALRRRAELASVTVLYGARSPADLLYVRELERWRRRGRLDVRVTVDHAPGGGWLGPVGVVAGLLDAIRVDGPRTVAMMCGPEVMMRFTARALVERGVSPDDVHVSLERNMKCAVALCGHCQLRDAFLCKDGPVLPLARVAPLLDVREI